MCSLFCHHFKLGANLFNLFSIILYPLTWQEVVIWLIHCILAINSHLSSNRLSFSSVIETASATEFNSLKPKKKKWKNPNKCYCLFLPVSSFFNLSFYLFFVSVTSCILIPLISCPFVFASATTPTKIKFNRKNKKWKNNLIMEAIVWHSGSRSKPFCSYIFTCQC